MSDDPPACEIYKDENDDVFVLVGGVKIAKRALRGTAGTAAWTMLQPGWLVRDIKGGKAIEIPHGCAKDQVGRPFIR
jgi:hypothetical protein